MNTNFKVIGLTRLGIKLKATAPKADALTPRPSELLVYQLQCIHLRDKWNAVSILTISTAIYEIVECV